MRASQISAMLGFVALAGLAALAAGAGEHAKAPGAQAGANPAKHHPGTTRHLRHPARLAQPRIFPIPGGFVVAPPARLVIVVPAVTYTTSAARLRYAAPLAAAALPAYTSLAPEPRVLYVPAYAIDGATFEAGGTRYRLRGFDAPGLAEPNGARARERLQQLLDTGPVTVYPVALDAHGRIVADVMVGGVNLAQGLRAEGYAAR